MRTYDEAYDASRDAPPFSCGSDGDAWIDANCGACVHDSPTLMARGQGCPLILIALNGRTPADWLPQQGGTHLCVEWRDRDNPGPGYEPPPDPPLPGQEALFQCTPHVRMYADVAAEVRREQVPA